MAFEASNLINVVFVFPHSFPFHFVYLLIRFMCKTPTCYLILPTMVKFKSSQQLVDDHKLLEIRFAGLEVAQCRLMLDKKQLEFDN